MPIMKNTRSSAIADTKFEARGREGFLESQKSIFDRR